VLQICRKRAMIVESSRLACPSSRQSNPPPTSRSASTRMFCSLPKRRQRCTNLPNPTARIGFFIGSLAKRRLRCTDLPNPTVRIGFFYAHLWVLFPSDGCDAPIFQIQPSGLASSTRMFGSFAQATAAMHRSSESNRQDWLPPASLGPWPSDGCDAPICLPNPTVRIVLHLFGP
jgi:hypothetical protein